MNYTMFYMEKQQEFRNLPLYEILPFLYETIILQPNLTALSLNGK